MDKGCHAKEGLSNTENYAFSLKNTESYAFSLLLIR